MKHKFILAAFAIVIIAYATSCTDILSTNLQKQSITILAPTNNYVSQSFTQVFWWDVVKGADKYNVQIVKPSFSAAQQLIVDTLVSENKYSQTLQPGIYQWRVKAVNSSSSTDYVTYNLTIDSTLNLSTQTLLLNTPADNFSSNNFAQAFSWLAMPNATSYEFKILDTLGTPIGNSQSVSTTSVSYTFTAEGKYKWRVFAQNNQSSSPYQERTITIDTTRPAIPVVTFAPLNDTTHLKPVPLAWSSVETNASYEVQVSPAPDSIFTSPIKDTTISVLTYKFYNPVSNQLYYWRVRAKDIAGNIGNYSVRHRFKVQ